MHRLPAWVPVKRGKDESKEVEGLSFNNFVDHQSFPYSGGRHARSDKESSQPSARYAP